MNWIKKFKTGKLLKLNVQVSILSKKIGIKQQNVIKPVEKNILGSSFKLSRLNLSNRM